MRKLSLLLVLLLCFTACTKSLIFATGTMVGIDVKTVEGGQQTANVGYERIEGAVMPVRKSDGELRQEAYSTLSIFDMDTGSLFTGAFTTTQIRQVFATGKAAQDASAVKAVVSAYQSISLDKKELGNELDDQSATDQTIQFRNQLKEIKSIYIELKRDSGKRDKAVAEVKKLVPGFTKDTSSTKITEVPASDDNMSKAQQVLSALKTLKGP